MESLQKFARTVSKDADSASASASSAISEIAKNFNREGGTGLTSPTFDQSRLVVNRVPRQAISFWNCSKLCAVFFVAGVFVGYTLKKRVRRWASKLLRTLKDD